MKVSAYRFSGLGLVGAWMFCLSTPISASLIGAALREAGEPKWQQNFQWALSPFLAPIFLLIPLVGFTWMLVGREIITDEK